jgi:UDP-GlcNAc:undecaprenyl-phosphate GlcNAc-1-phosphate transferase
MIFLGYFAFTLGFTIWASSIILKIGKNWLLDIPDERKIHLKPIPRTGGLALGIVYFISLIIFDFSKELWWYLAGSIPLFILGASDDHRSIRWPLKLVVQLSVSLIVVYQFLGDITAIQFFAITLNFSTIGLVAVFLIWFVGILNAVNLIDGMDGLAGGFMLMLTLFSILIGLVSGTYNFILLNSLLIGSLVGFILFNRKPAKFFMGDSGSLLLGYHVACLPLLFHQFSMAGEILEITPFLILSSFLIMDTTRVFFSRILRGQNPMNADTIHLHHLVFRETNSYMGTLIPIFFVTLITGLGAILFFIYGFGYLGMQLFLLILLIFVVTPPVPFYVPLASRLTNIIAHLKTSRFSNKHLFRVRYLPVLGFIYLTALATQVYMSISYSDLPIEFLIGISLLLIFFLSGVNQDESIQTGVILFCILQISFISQETHLPLLTGLGATRFICLILIVIIGAANYIENSRHLGFEFWSVLDLLIFLVFSGLLVLKLNGFSVPIIKWGEVLIMYYCLGIYGQHIHPRVSMKSLGAVRKK